MTTPPDQNTSRRRTIEHDDDSRALMLEARRAELDNLLHQHKQTNNPLYVWEAIRHCHHPNYPTPYPEWVTSYLHNVAVDLTTLGHLLNPYEFPERRDGETDEAHRARFDRWQKQTIPPEAAVGFVARVLGLVRKGWNGFQRFQADAAARMTALDFELPLEGSRRDVIDQILAAGVAEEGTVRRQIRRGRRLLERPAPTPSRAKPPP